jgi:hypothetical protein
MDVARNLVTANNRPGQTGMMSVWSAAPAYAYDGKVSLYEI